MILNRVEIYGFKSFARKTVINFDDDVTAVVGPNGSGKSNVVDAIRWALGEQRTKSMRLSKMEDVIFSGSNEKKALGYAQVTLIFNNENNIFKVDYDEISISRKVYRSGESEYSINKAVCRLRDIQEFFMDTGLGREGYSIIGQGQVESIINNSPSERKLLIEEAVGVVKYKSRKIEAERRLEKAQNNLYRISDIISEIEARLPSLKRQSEKAESYIVLRNRLKDIEVKIFVRKMDAIKAELAKHSEDKILIENSLADIDNMMEENRAKCEELKNLSLGQDRELIAINEEMALLDSEYEDAKINMHITLNKCENLEKTIAETLLSVEQIRGEIAKIDLIKEGLLKEKAEASDRVANLEREYDNLKRESQSVEDTYKQGNESIRVLKEKFNEIKSEIDALLRRKADTSDRINSLTHKKSNYELDKKEIGERIESLSALVMQEKNSDIVLIEKIREEINQKNEVQRNEIIKYDKTKEDLSHSFTELQTTQSKIKLLVGYEKSLSGYKYAIRKLMQAKENEGFCTDEIYGTLGTLVSTKPKYSEAITKAFGASLENIVLKDEHTAVRCIDLLKKNGWGRITFLPLNIVKPSRPPSENHSIHRGFISYANELVECEDRFKSVVSSILGRVLVVDTIENANVIAKKTGYRNKIVTLSGEVLFVGGAIVGGSNKGDEDSVLKRKNEIELLNKKLSTMSVDYDNLLRARDTMLHSIKLRKTELADLNEKYEKTREENSELLQNIRYGKEQLSKEQNKLTFICASEKEQTLRLDELSSEKEVIENALKISEDKLVEVQTEIEKLSSGEYRDAFLVAYDKQNQLQMEILKGREVVLSKENALAIYDEQIIKYHQNIKQKEELLVMLGLELENLTAQKEQSITTDSDYGAKKEKLKVRHSELSESKKINNNSFFEMNEKLQLLSSDRNDVIEKISKLEIKINAQDMEAEHLQMNMFEDYTMSYAAAIEYRDDEIDLVESVREVDEIKSKIKRLGNINVESVEEYKQTKARFEELSTQRDDLRDAKEDLITLIGDISSGMKERFLSQFELIQNRFNEVFTKLFNGGTAQLILTDPENVMDSGVDIVASPPKAKLKNIAALSGGEKSMTAISLIFAILSIKPSPFCILDEIDAALDDANAKRFCDYLLEIRDKNQFIMITHKKNSMEIADVIYGATMGRDGVTELVSVKMSQINSEV